MLRELNIRSLAIIDDLTVRFGPGLNVLTGETGAGKSIIVDALGLALGDRAQSDMVKSGEKEATVQAYFEIGDDVALPDIGIDTSDGLFIRRVLSSAGKSRAYINDTLVTLQTLLSVGSALVDIHSQHEHQSLLSQERQLDLVDLFGRLMDERKRVSELFDEFQKLRSESRSLSEKMRERAHRLDLLRYQVREIGAAGLKSGEQEGLEAERKILMNAARLGELAASSYALLYDSEGACLDSLSDVTSRVREIAAIDADASETLKLLESAVPFIKDASSGLREFKDRYETDPERLEAVGERIELIRRLEKKYGDSIEAVLRYCEEAEAEIRLIETADERNTALDEEVAAKAVELRQAADALSLNRSRAAEKLAAQVISALKELAFGASGFSISLSSDKDHEGNVIVGPSGADRAEFLFSANPGEPLRPLSKIISGGELSRVMLALKSILADVDRVPVLIFDEVDAGIGGKTAESVGKKLQRISKKRQLLCITHLPQLASLGDLHLKIEKKTGKGRVSVNVSELTGAERQDEIARMLSGMITDTSLRHAGELLERKG